MLTRARETERAEESRTGRDWERPDRWFGGLLVVLALSLPLLVHIGRKQYFFLDEWSFLVNRRLTDPSTLLEAHNGHWVTLPAIVWRVTFNLFGADSYRPYLVPAVLVHLGIVTLLWCVMRRLGVRPSLATLTALAFVFFGAGGYTILYAFTINLTGSVFFGLGQMLLADHDGSSNRRDALAVVSGLFATMCSAVGIPIVAGVAVAVYLRRGWRAAAVQVVPIALVNLAWYIAYGRDNTSEYSFGPDTFRFVERMGRSAFEGLGQYWPVAVALGIVALIGVVALVRQARTAHTTAPFNIAAGLIVSFVMFAWFTAVGRVDFGVESAANPRYIYVAAALFLPLIALGGEMLARRMTYLGALPILLLLIAVPRNVDLLSKHDPYTLGSRELVTSVAHSPLLEQLPRDARLLVRPTFPKLGPTAGWLRSAVAQGRLGQPTDRSLHAQLNADAAVALLQGGEPRGAQTCPERAVGKTVRLSRGDRIVFSGTITIAVVRGNAESFPGRYASTDGDTIEVRAGPIALAIAGLNPPQPGICDIVRAAAGSH